MFSELNKGENNPNSKANTTEQQRKSRSPFSKKFYEIRNLSEGERLSFINKVTKLKPVESWNTHIEFYTNKGLSYEDAKLALSKRQHTYKGGKFSKICQKFINDVLGENINSENFLFGKNELNLKDKEHNTHYMYDLTNTKTKCIIEFNGDFWHGNPTVYNKNDLNQLRNMTYEEICIKDARKLNYAKNKGYKILIIWESDYIKNKNNVILQAKKFIL